MKLIGSPSTISFPRLCAATILAALFSPGILSAYVLEGPSWPSASVVTFQMRLGNAGRTLSDGNTSWDVAAMPAAAAWTSVIQRVVFTSAINPSAPVSSGDHVNSVSFGSSYFGHSFGSGTLAVTMYRYSGNAMSEADVVCNTSMTWDSYRGPLRFAGSGYATADIRRVLIHELGHAIGLNHSNGDPIMNAYISNRETLANDDMNGAQALYGVGSPNPTPTPTPTPTPVPTPTPTPTPTPVPTPTPTPTPTPAATPAINVTASPTSIGSLGTSVYTIERTGGTSASLTVSFAMSGSAKVNKQYTISPSATQVTIPAGASSASVTLHAFVVKKNITKTATLLLRAGSSYGLSSPTSATVSISKTAANTASEHSPDEPADADESGNQ